MSCIATFYVLPAAEHSAFLSAKQREPRVEEKKVLFLKFRQSVAGEHVWDFLARVAKKKIDLEVSGFLLVDYLFVYLQISEKDYFERLDDYYSALPNRGAVALAAFLSARSVDRTAIDEYLKEDGRPLAPSERDETLAAYEKAHAIVLEWCDSITTDSFGVLHLSF
jgi:hypothetical protein